MKKIKLLLIAVILIHCNYSYGQWDELNTIPQRSILNLHFLDDNLGYAWMDSGFKLQKTSDGGETWTSIDIPIIGVEFIDIHFWAEGEGVFLIRDLDNEMAPTRIYQTLNDGVIWEDITPETTATGIGVGECHFFNQEVGYFSAGKSLYKTLDGGETWSESQFANYIIALNFIDVDNGTMGTWNGTFAYKGEILTTSDGGEKLDRYIIG